MTSRSDAWCEDRHLSLPDDEVATPKRFVVLELDGKQLGYAISRTHFGLEGGLPGSRLGRRYF
jgi:hypothetical protein